MIKFENYEVTGWEHAIRGMRNPMNSWDRSDSDSHSCGDILCDECPYNVNDYMCERQSYNSVVKIGPNDLDLMKRLIAGGPVEAKFRRMITIYTDITAPLYWWKEFDTYKVGTVANSCSTMHKINAKEFTLDDFSWEHLINEKAALDDEVDSLGTLKYVIRQLNRWQEKYLKTKDKKYWWQVIQLLPTSYNQKRTVMMNYEVLANIYKHRLNHKLDEWRAMCQWIEDLPYSQIITGDFDGGENDENKLD